MSVNIFSILLCVVVVLAAAATMGMVIYYDSRLQGKTAKEYVVDGTRNFVKNLKRYAPDFFKTFAAMVGALLRFAIDIYKAYEQTHRVRHCFTDDLWCRLDAVVNDYRYKRIDYGMDVDTSSLPYCLWIRFHTQKAATADLAQEVLCHVTAVFSQYLVGHNLPFQYFPFYYVNENEILITIHYCEYAQEYPLYKAKCDQIIRSNTGANSGTLEVDIAPLGDDGKILLGYSAEEWESRGAKVPFVWDYRKVPHAQISGLTGGGKSVLAQLMVMQLLEKGVDVSICDYKAGGDWDGIVPKYAQFSDCDAVVDDFFAAFVDAMQTGKRAEKFLVIDEFSSYALSKDAKEFKALMAKISQIAFMGRSFGFHLLLISQQFNAKVADTAIREQLGIKIYMGSKISTESAMMLFPNSNIDKSQALPEHCGYISTPERELDILQLPKIADPKGLKARLQELGGKYRT